MATSMMYLGKLEARRQALGLSCSILAKRTGLSLRTVQRVLSGNETDPGLRTVTVLAEALGVTLRFDEEDVEAIRLRQAERKADHLLALVQGTSALEVQAVPASVIASLKQRTVHELLAGSRRKLWAE